MVTAIDNMMEAKISSSYNSTTKDLPLTKKGRDDCPHIATSKRPFFDLSKTIIS